MEQTLIIIGHPIDVDSKRLELTIREIVNYIGLRNLPTHVKDVFNECAPTTFVINGYLSKENKNEILNIYRKNMKTNDIILYFIETNEKMLESIPVNECITIKWISEK